MDIYTAFRDMVDSLLEMHLAELDVTGEQFAAVCEAAAQQQVGMEVLEQILAVEDFLSFKKMMVKRNMELELESLRALQELTDKVEGGETEQEPDADEDDFEAQLKVRMPITMCPRARAFSHPPPARRKRRGGHNARARRRGSRGWRRTPSSTGPAPAAPPPADARYSFSAWPLVL